MDHHADTDLATRLDRAIGPAPETAPPLLDVVAAGRRVLRRRRVALATTVATAAVVVVASAAVIGGLGPATDGSSGDDRVPVAAPTAVDPTPAVSGLPETIPGRAAVARAVTAVAFDQQGVPAFAAGVEVLERIDDPAYAGVPLTAVLYRFEQRTYFAVGFGAGGGSVSQWAGQHELTLARWLRVQVSHHDTTPDTTPEPQQFPGVPVTDLVRFAGSEGEELAPLAGVRILQQRPGVEVGESFAGAEDDTAAALVRDRDGGLRYVIARRGVRLEPLFIAVAQADGGADLDAFLVLARTRYAEGGGGLL